MAKAAHLSLCVNIVTDDTTVVYTGACILERVTVNEPSAGTITIYNNSEASGTTVATISPNPVAGTYGYGCLCGSGVTVVTAGSPDITVVINPLGFGVLGTPASPPPVSDPDSLLLESGDQLLLESGDLIVLEA